MSNVSQQGAKLVNVSRTPPTVSEKSNVRLSVLDAKQSMAGWEQSIGPLLAKSLEYARGRYTIEDLHSWVSEESASVMIAWDPDMAIIHAAFLLEGCEYPNKKVLSITAAGGDSVKEWIHLFPAFSEVAREMGFEQIEVVGRPGWERLLVSGEDSGSYTVSSKIIKDV